MREVKDYHEAIANGWEHHRNGSSGRGFFAAYAYEANGAGSRLPDGRAPLRIDPNDECNWTEHDDAIAVPFDIVSGLAALDHDVSAQDENVTIARYTYAHHYRDGTIGEPETFLLVMVDHGEEDRSLDVALRITPDGVDAHDPYRGDVICGAWRRAQAEAAD